MGFKSQEEIKIAVYILSLLLWAREKNYEIWTTSLQKLLFLWFLSENDREILETYRAYLYGPYSSKVSEVADLIKLYGLIEADDTSWGARLYKIKNNIPEELSKLIIQKTANFQKFLESFEKNNKKYLKNLQRLANLSKILWLKKMENIHDINKIKNKLKLYNWKIPKKELEEIDKKLKSQEWI
ncbi:hypothetical protein [Thermosulfurimonas sp. F29]|uniref:hypothetical protein n=1 Tax=Thermosulfurimonas sp. F29 TaxID=2867247 RepID=UPI001C838C8F|nr:hypothetical protein [Thermosulfurimonas sp. F29]MBX6424138.1 hypothetical protein [Thermosulfurimonas sp. F29]